jgi:hypothetical protein
MPANEPAGQEMEEEHIFEKGDSDLLCIGRKPLNLSYSGGEMLLEHGKRLLSSLNYVTGT